MRKILFSLFFVIFSLVFFLPGVAFAQNSENPDLVRDDTTANIYFFYSNTCPHCREEKPFLGFLKEQYGEQVNIYAYEASQRKTVEILNRIAPKVGLETGSVPITLLADKVLVGYADHESSGLALQEKLVACLDGQEVCEDVVGPELTEEELAIGEITFKNVIKPDKKEISRLVDKYGSDELKSQKSNLINTNNNLSTTVNIPFVGTTDAREFSLPVLALVIGFLDGFNPCAMWVLLFLISLLLGLQDRRKMWLFGTVFILASGFVYFLFMTAWLNAFLLFGVVTWVRVGIALLALGVGIYQLREYKLHGNTCQITGNEKRQRTFEQLKKLVLQQNVLLALVGLVALAFAVNLVELMCSAGFPAIFTSVLAMSDLSIWQYYFYIGLYLLMFLIDDLVVFALAMVTLESKIVGEKYAKYSKLIGGILMVLIGLLLILKPELLMFG